MNELGTLLFITFLSLFYKENSICGANSDCSKAISGEDKKLWKGSTLLKLNRQISKFYLKLDKNGEYYTETVRSQRNLVSNSNFVVYDFEGQHDFLKFISLFSNCLETNKEFKACYDDKAKIELQKYMEN